MKKRWFFLILVILLAFISIVAERTPQPEPEGLRLYFPYQMQQEERRDSAVGYELYQGPVGKNAAQFPGPRLLMNALLNGPMDEKLESPFPGGVTLENWRWDPEQKGNLQIRLSEQYSGLTDIGLTLADYCIVLTVSQLPGVATVEISSAGHSSNYRTHKIRSVDEVLLTDSVAFGALHLDKMPIER